MTNAEMMLFLARESFANQQAYSDFCAKKYAEVAALNESGERDSAAFAKLHWLWDSIFERHDLHEQRSRYFSRKMHELYEHTTPEQLTPNQRAEIKFLLEAEEELAKQLAAAAKQLRDTEWEHS